MQRAFDAIPKQLHSCTPVSVKATAGLRLLGDDQSNTILKAVENRLRSRWPFQLVQFGSQPAVSVMDGKDEALFAWLTVNYLLDRFGSISAKPATAAVMDLGGASTQVNIYKTLSFSKFSVYYYNILYHYILHLFYQFVYLVSGKRPSS
jgi:guanosine-diphosphatase